VGSPSQREASDRYDIPGRFNTLQVLEKVSNPNKYARKGERKTVVFDSHKDHIKMWKSSASWNIAVCGNASYFALGSLTMIETNLLLKRVRVRLSTGCGLCHSHTIRCCLGPLWHLRAWIIYGGDMMQNVVTGYARAHDRSNLTLGCTPFVSM